MRFLGAKVVLTPRAAKGTGMYRKAKELADANGWFFARQFETEANARVHEETTGPEIVADFADERLDYFVTGYGTGGTLTGVGRVLRRERPGDQDRPQPNRPMPRWSAAATSQARNADGSPAESHPAFEPHPIQGWMPDFVPLVLQEAIDRQVLRRARRRSPAPRRWRGREGSPRRRASSPASPAGPASPPPCGSPRRRRPAR